jgi:hypothetical protein
MAFQLSPADLAEVSSLSLDQLRDGLSQMKEELDVVKLDIGGSSTDIGRKKTLKALELGDEMRAWIRAYQCALLDALEKEMAELEKAECGCGRTSHDEMAAAQALWDELDKERCALVREMGCRCGDISGETVIVWCERCEMGETEKPVALGASASPGGTVITSPPSAGTLQELLLAAAGKPTGAALPVSAGGR